MQALLAFACGDDTPGEPRCARVAPPEAAPRAASGEVRYTLPAPSGPYAVGTAILHVVDVTRDEPVTPEPGDRRELVVQLFYPADADDVAGADAAPLVSDAEAEVLFADLGQAEAGAIAAHSIAGVPLSAARERWPVLVYSHGLGSNRNDNRTMVESLASHGIVVAAVSHTYYDGGATLSDGHVTAREALPEVEPEGFIEGAAQVWREDVMSVLGELETLSGGASCTFLSDRLELERLAVAGYSFGGSTAYQVCASESRCRAGVNLDGTYFGPIGTPLAIPFMHVGTNRTSLSWDVVAARSLATTFSVRLEGTTHGNFFGLARAMPALGVSGTARGLGPIDPERGELILRSYVEAFILEQLLGEPPSGLLNGPSASYPEVAFERSDAPTTPRVRGDAWSVLDGAPLSGASVAIGEETTTTSATGAWSSGALARDSVVRVDITHEGFMPWSATVQVGTHAVLLDAAVIRSVLVNVALGPAGLTADPARGHVLVIGERVAPGLTVAVADATSYYLAPSNAIDPALQATGSSQLALVPNVVPGMVALTFAHPAMRCTAPLSPRDEAGAVLTEVLAGALSTVRVICER